MSDHMPPLADLLPHLHAGDHITAEFRDGYTISGPLTSAGNSGLMLRGSWMRFSSSKPSFNLAAITSAPAAHQRWMDAQQPTWADGTPADDDTVRIVIATKGTWDHWARISPTAVWWKLGRERSQPVKTEDLLALGAVPVAWERTDQPAPEPPSGYVMEPTWCAAGVGGGEVCARRKGHEGKHDPDAAPEPATCDRDRDHEPPQRSIVKDAGGHRWRRGVRGWWRHMVTGNSADSWTDLWDDAGPLTLVKDGTNTGAEQ